jgi:hypothetical protein
MWSGCAQGKMIEDEQSVWVWGDAAGRRQAVGATALASLLLWLAFASFAAAGPPTHLPLEDPIGGFPLNHACGAAVDSEGNIYVSNAGSDKIEVFDSAGKPLTSILNSNDPCGLAIDGAGNVYASEKATGKVIKYQPTEYPFTGTPTYSSPIEIDSSGEAEGISVDPFDDRLYVAKGSRIDVYRSDGVLGENEEQSVRVAPFATGGTFTLSFEGDTTGPLKYDASHGEIEAALKALTTIGSGNLQVSEGSLGSKHHIVTFIKALGSEDVQPITADPSGLEGEKNVFTLTLSEGFSGSIGEGDLSGVSGVAAYTYEVSGESADHYVFAADTTIDQVRIFGGHNVRLLKLREEIEGVDHDYDPETPDQEFGFGAAGTYLAIDPGNSNVEGKCFSVAKQACTAGHLLVYDDAHKVVDEIEASGKFLDQIPLPEAFEDAEPTALAVSRSGGVDDGTIYITSGAGAGAKLLAFDPLTSPIRLPLEKLSQALPLARAVVTDSFGNVYVAAGPLIHVYGPDGDKIEAGPKGEGIPTAKDPKDLAVDATGKIYTLVGPNLGGNPAEVLVQYYTPSIYPPEDGTEYTSPVTVATGNSLEKPGSISGIGIDPVNDHLYVAGYSGEILVFGPAAEGSKIIDPCFACEVTLPGDPVFTNPQDVAIYGANGNVYVPEQLGRILVIDPGDSDLLDDEKIVARITGVGSPGGSFGSTPGVIAVDQSNGHVLVFDNEREVAEEYDASGAFVAQFGQFTTLPRPWRIAIDNSGGSTNGNVYVAYDDTAPESFDLTAFGPLTYGAPPKVAIGVPSGLGSGNATLNGTVEPRGFELEDCHFDYLPDAVYQANLEFEQPPFEGSEEMPCVPGLAEIGSGTEAVPVHANLSGLDPDGRYRFRLVAENEHGLDEGETGLFGPPAPTTKKAVPILYDEATLRAEVDPSGLATKYRFEFGASESYGQSTPTTELSPGDEPVAVDAELTGLAEGITYHFRVVAENEAKIVFGSDQEFTTLRRTELRECPNTEFRTGLSAKLPDCRVYELVTPAETRGSIPFGADGPGSPGEEFNNWLVAPRGATAGDTVAYFSKTLPGFEGIGKTDGYLAQRAPGDHPSVGWGSEMISPTYAQAGGEAHQHGIAADQLYGFFSIDGATATFERGEYLRTPLGFELVGRGGLGTDLEADSHFVSTGGFHVIFSSDGRLEEDAAPQDTVAVYDRAAGLSSAEVVSVKPDGSSFGADDDAKYLGVSEDGSSVAFEVNGSLYVHREGATVEVATTPSAFAGISEDGKRVFYIDLTLTDAEPTPAGLFACDVEEGPCVGGGEPPGLTEIAKESIIVSISPDGSHVLFTSKDALTGAEENEAGESAQASEPNLYVWNGTAIGFVAILDSTDFVSFDDFLPMNLRRWTHGVRAGAHIGRDNSPTRSTPGGEVFLFQSHAQLTSYDNEGHGEIYRYEPGAASGQQLICISCDPTGTPPSGDALLQTTASGGATKGSTLIANITDDGQMIFFESPDRLLPEDANNADDVYQWRAQGAGVGVETCTHPGGCLALISSGQGEEPSYLYGMTADGQDVFFATREKLIGDDVSGSPSIYDARMEGGIPDPPVKAPCQGDACQGQGSIPPTLLSPGRTTVSGEGKAKEGRPRLRCPKGKRKVRRKGKVRCVRRRGSERNRR